jgi:hypothetical protein
MKTSSLKRKNHYDSEFLSYNLMLNSGKKIRAWRDKKNKYSNSCVVRTNFSELQVKWSVPKLKCITGVFCCRDLIYSQACLCGHLYEAVTCIRRSLFSCPVIENFIRIEPLLRGHLS